MARCARTSYSHRARASGCSCKSHVCCSRRPNWLTSEAATYVFIIVGCGSERADNNNAADEMKHVALRNFAWLEKREKHLNELRLKVAEEESRTMQPSPKPQRRRSASPAVPLSWLCLYCPKACSLNGVQSQQRQSSDDTQRNSDSGRGSELNDTEAEIDRQVQELMNESHATWTPRVTTPRPFNLATESVRCVLVNRICAFM